MLIYGMIYRKGDAMPRQINRLSVIGLASKPLRFRADGMALYVNAKSARIWILRVSSIRCGLQGAALPNLKLLVGVAFGPSGGQRYENPFDRGSFCHRCQRWPRQRRRRMRTGLP
jgi:hypothetical protein